MQSSIDLNPLDNSKPHVCSDCGGKCCQFRPGLTDITDWGETESERKMNMEKALRTGHWCIDPWDGDPTGEGEVRHVNMIRPSGKNHIGELYHAPFFEFVSCTFLGPSGCFFSYKDRPLMCRALIPNEQDPHAGCEGIDLDLKRKMAIRWMEYNEFLENLHWRLQHEEPNSNGERPVRSDGNNQEEAAWRGM